MEENYLFSGLRALAKSAFPKRCNTCGRTYANEKEFLKETEQLRKGVSGLKQSRDDDDSVIIEVYRNCPCGSTLMDVFSDRRDNSENGLRRRIKFGELIDYLIVKGVEKEIARMELLKVLRGERSEVLKQFSDKMKK